MNYKTTFPDNQPSFEEWAKSFNVGKLYSKFTPCRRVTEKNLKIAVIKKAQKAFADFVNP